MPVYRAAMTQLQEWEMKKRRKPRIIWDARQKGKTELMKEFGTSEYVSTVYILFDNNERMQMLLGNKLEIERLIAGAACWS